MSLNLSSRHEWVRRSELRSMSVECEKVGGVNLSQGVCDLEVPEVVRKAAHAAIEAGRNSYSRHDGTAELRRAVARRYERLLDRDIDPESNVVVSAGATGALYCACLALLEPGDEVILFEPYYSYHQSTLMATQAEPVYVPTSMPDWSFSQDDLDNALSDRTRAIIINTPSNPSGKVWSRDELEQIAAFCVKHDLFVFTDEIYEHFVYDGLEHVSLASLPGMWDRTITISGLSKTFSITGWRIGYVAAHRDIARPIGLVNDLYYVCAPSVLQYAVADAIDSLGDDYYESLASDYRKKRDEFCAVLTEIGLTPHVPEGAYYVLADVGRLGCDTAFEAAECLLEEARVASIPGSAFFRGTEGERFTRFCFAKEDETLARASELLREWSRRSPARKANRGP